MFGAACSAVRSLPEAGARAAGSGVVARGGAPGSAADAGTHLSRQLGAVCERRDAVAGLSPFGRGFAWLGVGVGVGGSGGGGCGGGGGVGGGGGGGGCWRGGTTATRALCSSSGDGGGSSFPDDTLAAANSARGRSPPTLGQGDGDRGAGSAERGRLVASGVSAQDVKILSPAYKKLERDPGAEVRAALEARAHTLHFSGPPEHSL